MHKEYIEVCTYIYNSLKLHIDLLVTDIAFIIISIYVYLVLTVCLNTFQSLYDAQQFCLQLATPNIGFTFSIGYRSGAGL